VIVDVRVTKTYVLSLNEEQASALYALLGAQVAGGPTEELFMALHEACHTNHYPSYELADD
jgi:hypothetical protein